VRDRGKIVGEVGPYVAGSKSRTSGASADRGSCGFTALGGEQQCGADAHQRADQETCADEPYVLPVDRASKG
jgi:hypothetical protein